MTNGTTTLSAAIPRSKSPHGEEKQILPSVSGNKASKSLSYIIWIYRSVIKYSPTIPLLQPQKRIEREGSFQEVEGAGAGVVDDEFGDLIFVAAVDVDFDFAIA